MNAVVKPKLTEEERVEKWWSRRPLPFYVRTKEKHSEETYLVQTREDLAKIARNILAYRAGYGYYGNASDYFQGTYEAYVEEHIGMSVEEADRLLMNKTMVAPEMQRLRERYMGLKRAFQDEKHEAATIRSIGNMLDSSQDVNPLAIVQLLVDRSSYQYEGFEICQFNRVSD